MGCGLSTEAAAASADAQQHEEAEPVVEERQMGGAAARPDSPDGLLRPEHDAVVDAGARVAAHFAGRDASPREELVGRRWGHAIAADKTPSPRACGCGALVRHVTSMRMGSKSLRLRRRQHAQRQETQRAAAKWARMGRRFDVQRPPSAEGGGTDSDSTVRWLLHAIGAASAHLVTAEDAARLAAAARLQREWRQRRQRQFRAGLRRLASTVLSDDTPAATVLSPEAGGGRPLRLQSPFLGRRAAAPDPAPEEELAARLSALFLAVAVEAHDGDGPEELRFEPGEVVMVTHAPLFGFWLGATVAQLLSESDESDERVGARAFPAGAVRLFAFVGCDAGTCLLLSVAEGERLGCCSGEEARQHVSNGRALEMPPPMRGSLGRGLGVLYAVDRLVRELSPGVRSGIVVTDAAERARQYKQQQLNNARRLPLG